MGQLKNNRMKMFLIFILIIILLITSIRTANAGGWEDFISGENYSKTYDVSEDDLVAHAGQLENMNLSQIVGKKVKWGDPSYVYGKNGSCLWHGVNTGSGKGHRTIEKAYKIEKNKTYLYKYSYVDGNEAQPEIVEQSIPTSEQFKILAFTISLKNESKESILQKLEEKNYHLSDDSLDKINKANWKSEKNNDSYQGAIQTALTKATSLGNSSNTNYGTYVMAEALVKEKIGYATAAMLVVCSEESGENSQQTGIISGTWHLEPQDATAQIQKKKSNNTDWAIQGIKFEVRQGNTYKGTITTDPNGLTNKISGLQQGQYTIKEISNSQYGYKGNSGKEVNFTISNNDLGKNKIIGFKNTKELVNLKIEKQDENGKTQEHVDFKIKITDSTGTKNWLKILNGNNKVIRTSAVIIDQDNKSSEMHVEYVTNESDATIFQTDSNGEINVSYLERYCAKDKEYTYEAVEISSSHYGYSGIKISGATSGNDTIELNKDYANTSETEKTIIKNIPQYKDLTIEKTGKDNIKLPNVEMIVKIKNPYISDPSKTQERYLQIFKGKSTTHIAEINTDITISGPSSEKNKSDDKYYVNYTGTRSEATTFKTKADGTIKISGLEENFTKTIKFVYEAIETRNLNYGYGHYTNGTQSATNNGNTITVTNTPEYRNITIKKKGTGVTLLPNVEFKLHIASGTNEKYIKIYNGKTALDKVTQDITITDYKYTWSNQVEGKYYVEYVENKEDGTTFVTKSNGKITVENLEKYYEKGKECIGKECIYRAEEITNPNYGYGQYTNGNESATNSDDLITVTNTQIFTDKTIIKKGENNRNLAGVKFALQAIKGNTTKYIKIYKGNEAQKEITNNIEIEGYYTSNTSNSTLYYLEYVDKVEDATLFATKSDGSITIKELEKYYEKEKEVVYKAIEKENPNYGYGYYNDGDLSEKNNGDTISLTNNPTYYDREITKVGEENVVQGSVRFVLKQQTDNGTRYVKLKSKLVGRITTVVGTATINRDGSNIEFVDKKENATEFVTDANGKISIKNLEKYYAKDKEYKYVFEETYNAHIWYKNYIKQYNETEIKEEKTTITNTPISRNITLEKQGEFQEKLPNVEFVIKVESTENNQKIEKYIQIYKGKSLTPLSKITEDITISGEYTDKNKTENGYYLAYTGEESRATRFVTKSDGTITIHKLETYYSYNAKYSYFAVEKYNPNYGYKGPENDKTESIGDNVRRSITNKGTYGNIEVLKTDSRNERIPLSGMKFRMKISDGTMTKYIKIKNKTEVTGIIEIEKANPNIEYVDKVEEATTFITDESGKTGARNLEIYHNFNGDLYKYTIEEIDTLSHYGYKIDGDIQWIIGRNIYKGTSVNVIIPNRNDTVNVTVLNTQKYTKITGYVWDDIGNDGKTTTRNHLYSDGEYDKNDRLLAGIKVDLYDKDGKIVETKYTDKDGKYTFGVNNDGTYTYDNYKISIADISKYYVEFTYNGMKYTSCDLHIDKANGSKAAEKEEVRKAFNNNFTEISAGKTKDAEKGTSSGVANNGQSQQYTEIMYGRINEDGSEKESVSAETDEYYKSQVSYTEGQKTIGDTGVEMTVAYGVDKYHIISTTSGNYTLTYNPKTIEEIDAGVVNVNQGLVQREQIDLALTSDLENVKISANNYDYTYLYGKRNYKNMTSFDVGVKYNQNKDDNTGINSKYSRTVYPSDVIWHLKDRVNNKMEVYVTYKITIKNQSTNLYSKVSKLVNYYDTRYTITGITVVTEDNDKETTSEYKNNGELMGEEVNGYKASLIDLSSFTLTPSEYNFEKVYITYQVSDDAIAGLLENDVTLNNVSEICSYRTTTEDGTTYASIDSDSAPGNAMPGNPQTYEDDTDRSPSFTLTTKNTKNRTTMGTVFRDNSIKQEDGTRNGNGIFDEGEKEIAGVKVEILDAKTNQIAKVYTEKSNLSGKDAVTTTTDDGSYSIEGLIPGSYIVRYTYSNGKTKTTDGENINVYDYKGTIYTNPNGSEENKIDQQFWHLKEIDKRYSDAIDDYNMRKAIDAESKVINYDTASKVNSGKTDESKFMQASTPTFTMNVENTEGTTTGTDEIKEYKVTNIDFGIVDRAKQSLMLSKVVSNVRLTLGNGNTIVDGNPIEIKKNDFLQYLPGYKDLFGGTEDNAKIVLDPTLMQSATIEIKYNFVVTNKSEADYATEAYYKYGTIPTDKDNKLIILNFAKVIDYIDNEMSLDEKQNENWKIISNYQTELANKLDPKYNAARNEFKQIVITQETNEEILPAVNGRTESDVQKKLAEMKLSKIVGITSAENEGEYKNSAEILEIEKTTTEKTTNEQTGSSVTYETEETGSNGEKVTKTIIPGTYEPGTAPKQPTESRSAKVTITPPTGEDKQTNIVIITSAVISLVIVAAGITIVLIKKNKKD